MRLLQLVEQFDFVILEDDYHYTGSPILPLASACHGGRVLYAGSLSKVLSPAFRIGYVVGLAALVEEMGFVRHLISSTTEATRCWSRASLSCWPKVSCRRN